MGSENVRGSPSGKPNNRSDMVTPPSLLKPDKFSSAAHERVKRTVVTVERLQQRRLKSTEMTATSKFSTASSMNLLGPRLY